MAKYVKIIEVASVPEGVQVLYETGTKKIYKTGKIPKSVKDFMEANTKQLPVPRKTVPKYNRVKETFPYELVCIGGVLKFAALKTAEAATLLLAKGCFLIGSIMEYEPKGKMIAIMNKVVKEVI